MENIEDLQLSDAFLGVIEPGDLRRSTRRLKDRIKMQYVMLSKKECE